MAQSRFTISNLRNVIEEVNQELKNSGSLYSYKESKRNGYYAVDLCKDKAIVRNLDCNEPARVLADKVKDDYLYYLNK